MMKLLRSAFVIGRRDFNATVLSKAFIFFLIGPMLPILFGGIFGVVGAQVAHQAEQPVIAVVASEAEFARLHEAREKLLRALGPEDMPGLVRFGPEPDLAAQQKKLLANSKPPVLAVLYANEQGQVLTGAITRHGRTAGRVQLLLAHARADGPPLPPLRVVETGESSGKLARERSFTGRAGQFLIFFLTLLLATMLLSQVIEEKSNKIIEVIAAAIPIDAMFLGKLFAMLAASVVGIIVWTTLGALLIGLASDSGLSGLPVPAVGWPAFLALGVIYFATNYLVLGALFLGIGAQASTPREVQTLSMPVTMLQVIIFGFASVALGQSDSPLATAGAVFPLSSPLVMIARAAESSSLTPHLLAVAWQILWVAIIIRIGARFFRSRVLKSGPAGSASRRSARA